MILCISCNTSKFVIEQNNYFIDNINQNGIRNYKAYGYTSSGGSFYDCIYEKKLSRLNGIIPCDTFIDFYGDTFDLSCEIYISFNYLERMNEYVKKNDPNLLSEMLVITEEKYDSVMYYYDSVNFFQGD